MKGEDFQDLFARVSSYYAKINRCSEVYEYMSKMWFMQQHQS